MEKLTEITTFKQIKAIIEPIAVDKFCINKYQNDEGQCCFLGHIQKHISGKANNQGNGFGARQLTQRFILDKHNIFSDGAKVNNSTVVNGYIEPVIKDRLMHMIEDGIKWEESKLTT